ncbi:Cof-type HAD-IIB family hydrolase [Clostridium sp. DSM 100503]|uniref:Cof-type HAD-IIB family hydrolase n=1 Tax=Clostridium sp. DSM 100503 TaxID=2963282 RepID=UPI002149FAE9|nr:Cof-type HAD-IIB family hydrolase [Clostridium sp. DSM 100503]MCR1950681.1 Cof-type HAD-IIB family hydrolase [Clostridium sp. DSM 100503]
MKQNIKLICIDMDGTLLNSKHEISERNKEALRKANSLGVNIAITTGRLFCSARYYADLIGIDSPVIGSNGAYIKHKYDDIAILENPIPKDVAIEIYKIVKKHGLTINFNSWDTLIREDEVPATHAYTIMNKYLPDDKKVKFIVNSDVIKTINNFDGKILKGIVIEEAENKNNLWAAKDELKETFGDKLHVVSSGTDNFEVMFGTTSKGNAVAYLADTLNINPQEVMCIGDSENDISMLKFAGISVAMGNGLQIVKDIAGFVTDTNNNDGVAKAIEMFVLK